MDSGSGEANAEESTSGAPRFRPRADRVATVGICLFLAALVWLTYGQTIRHAFLDYDDDLYIYQNFVVTAGLTPQGILWALTFARIGHWHPLTWLSHMLDCQLWGLWAGGHHLTNVVLHGGAAILLFLFLRQMTRSHWRSAFVAVLFAVHPQRVESVAWIAERKDVLSGFFFMATILAYLRYVRRGPSLSNYLLVGLLFALGLMSKGMLVTLPFLLLLLDYWPLQRLQPDMLRFFWRPENRAVVRKLLVEKIPLFLLSAVSCLMTSLSPEQIAPDVAMSLPARLASALVSYVIYLRQMLLPTGLTIPYFNPPGGFPLWQVSAALAFLLAVSLGVGMCWRTRPYLLVGWLWYLGIMAPVIGIVQISYYARADRYTYLPHIGLSVMLVWGGVELFGRWRAGRYALTATALLLLMGLVTLTRGQVSHWRDSATLWSHALKVDPRNDVALNNFGAILAERGEIDAALSHFRAALEIRPLYADAYANIGSAFTRQGRIHEAIAQYEKAVDLQPNNPQMQNNFGAALAQESRLTEAIPHFQKAIDLQPGFPDPHHNLGSAFFMQGRIDEALAQLSRALELNPRSAGTKDVLTAVQMEKGRQLSTGTAPKR